MDSTKENAVAKPLGVAREDFVKNVINAINNSQMPLILVSYLLKDILSEVESTILHQDSAEKSRYEELINGTTNNEKKSKKGN